MKFTDKHGFSIKCPSQKESPWSRNTLFSDKENISGVAISKEGHADSLLEHERNHRY